MKGEIQEFMSQVAQKAGSTLMDSFQLDQELITARSTAKEAATKYDKLVDQLIIEEIRKTYPHHSLLTEESGYHGADPDWLWIIDSLDGTGNFASHNPFFAVCLALVYQGELTCGVIYAPALDEFYSAEKGKGAYLNQKRIHVSTRGELKESYLFYCEGGDTNRKRTGTILHTVYPTVTDIRKLGSAGLETAWVAAGRAEAYFTTTIEPWDVAPGVLLVTEAGGEVSDFTGMPWRQKQGDFVFSNGKVHASLLELLQKKLSPQDA